MLTLEKINGLICFSYFFRIQINVYILIIFTNFNEYNYNNSCMGIAENIKKNVLEVLERMIDKFLSTGLQS